VVAILYVVVYLAGWSALRQSEDERPRLTPWGAALWCAVAIPSVLQFAIPVMLQLGRRDASAVGQWWRLLTSMFLQDGGVPGTVFNLVTLAISVVLVGAVLRGPTMIAVFVAGGLVSNLLTIGLLHQSGAGNSMATMCLVVLATVVLKRRTEVSVIPLVAVFAAAAALLALHDQHGFAVTLGLVAGFLWRHGRGHRRVH
jgi:membrane associated rhomboid family serine protease